MASDSTKLASSEGQTDSVIVGLRIRPLLSRDLAEGAQECLKKVHGEPQVVLGGDRAFTYNHVFDPATTQEAVYQGCMRPLVESVFEGTRTVLGTARRARQDAHDGHRQRLHGADSAERRADPAPLASCASVAARTWRAPRRRAHRDFKEDVDLLGTLTTPAAARCPSARRRAAASLISTPARCRASTGDGGPRGRRAEPADGATAMNASSSRSHAIFTISLSPLESTGKAQAKAALCRIWA